MTVSIAQLHLALVRQASELAAPELRNQPQTVAQQLLYQSRLDPASATLAGPAMRRLRQLGRRPDVGLTLATRWSTSVLRERIRPNRGQITGLHVSADGSVVLFSGEDQTLHRWQGGSSAAWPESLGVLRHRISTVSGTAAADRAVTGDHEGSVHLWHVLKPGRPPQLLWRHERAVRAVAMDAQGTTVVSGSDDGATLVGRPGEAPRALRQPTFGGVRAAAIAPDGSFAVTSQGRSGVWFWDLTTEDPAARQLVAEAEDAYTAVTVSPDGTVVAAVTRTGCVYVWDVTTGETVARLLGRHSLQLWAVVVTDNGQVIAGGTDGQVLAWNLPTGAGPTVLGIHDRSVTALACDRSGNLISAGKDGLLLRYRFADDAPANAGQRHTFEIWTVRCLADGSAAVTAGRDGVYLWDLGTATPPEPVRLSDASVRKIAVLADGSGFVSLTYDNELLLHDLANPDTPRLINARRYQGTYQDLAVTPDGRAVITAGDDGSIQRWNLTSPQPPRTIGFHNSNRVRRVAVSPDGEFVISTDDYRRLLRWRSDPSDDEVLNWRPLGSADSRPRPIRCIAVTRNDVVLGDDAGTVRRLSVNGFGSTELGRHRADQKVRSLAVGDNGSWVVSIADDGDVCCWAMDASGPLAVLVPAALPRTVVTGAGKILIGDRNGGLTLVDVLPAPGSSAVRGVPAASTSTSTPLATAPAAPTAPADGPPMPLPVFDPAARLPATPPPVAIPVVQPGGLTIVVDQVWTRAIARTQRLEFASLRTYLAAGRPNVAVLASADVPGLHRLRQAARHLDWHVADVAADAVLRVADIVRVVDDVLRHGEVLLVSGRAEILAAVAAAPRPGLRIVDDLTGYFHSRQPGSPTAAGAVPLDRGNPPAEEPRQGDDARTGAGNHPTVVRPIQVGDLAAAENLLVRAIDTLPVRTPTASAVKAAMLRLDPQFSEQTLGFARFRDLLRAMPHRVRVVGQSGADITVALVDDREPPD
ncbi:WD40 repeat [Micromonospora nigra]|uniref:WD40 repeat n=1 Tax=Micromonospora nigra TaxID=145857 RepID=A0A1C6SI51_9ACTN|nr:OST-HTH/LOTUS domain-containing protein [Micromonospora nigra]SCL29220.1 WD40 repeat [Micromonospora nigra]